MNQPIVSSSPILMMAVEKEGPVVKKSKNNKKKEISLKEEKEINLSYDTQRMRKAKSLAPVSSILIQASPTEEMSFQPTIPMKHSIDSLPISEGATIATKIGFQDFRKSQVIMLFSASGLGLLIGLFIAFFI